MNRFLGKLASILVVGYQRFISPWMPPSCRFYPTCSEYSRVSFERHGFIKTIPNTSRSITFVDDNIAFTEDEISIINALFPHSKFVVVKHLNDIVNKMNKYKRPGGKFKALGLLNKRLKNVKVKVD